MDSMDVKVVIRDAVVASSLRSMKKGKISVERGIKDLIIYSADSAFLYKKLKDWLDLKLKVQYVDQVLASGASKTVFHALYNITLDGMLSSGDKAEKKKEGDEKGKLHIGKIMMWEGTVATISTLVEQLFLL
jgi:hypothetical protein